MRYYQKFFGHLKNIFVHKYFVFKYCKEMGIPWQGITHDLSKFSPTEFFESVKYYQGNSSPIPACKKVNGYSEAWQHHKGRNKHHYEYWTDNYDKGTTTIQMPPKYVLEMMADWLAAGRTYHGPKFTFDDEYDWWQVKKTLNPTIHPATMYAIDRFMGDMKCFMCVSFVKNNGGTKVIDIYYNCYKNKNK